jgi:uncharacterized YigZ family protein
MERYITIKQASCAETVVNRSRFISQCFPVRDEEEALALLNVVRADYPDASHTCYAYRAGARGETTRFSDAGEPSGTAGMPILEVLRTNEVTFALCTVTRYFGGVLLGTGGLARAYGGGALDALRRAGRVEMIPALRYELVMDYPRFASLEGYLRKACQIDGIDYADTVAVRAAVSAADAPAFAACVIDRSEGRVTPRQTGEGLIEREF